MTVVLTVVKITDMRILFTVIISLIICVLISSCNQEGCTDMLAVNYSNDANVENGSCVYPFYAGEIEHGGVILELENPLEMSFVWDEEYLYGFAELFLDLDSDGNEQSDNDGHLMTETGFDMALQVGCSKELAFDGKLWFEHSLHVLLYQH